jgi:Ca-activated chloride channel family protein
MNRSALTLTSVLLLAWSSPAIADGLFYDPASDTVVGPSQTDVDVLIEAQVATTTVTLTYAAPEASDGSFMFPLPEDASAFSFAIKREGVWQEATLQNEAPEAVPETATVETQAALDLYMGSNPFVVQVNGPFEGGKLEVKLRYIEILPYLFGSVDYVYPLYSGPFSDYELAKLKVTINLYTGRKLKDYTLSPNEVEFSVASASETHLNVTASQVGLVPTANLTLRYAEQQDGLYAYLLTHHESCSQEGYFLLILEPMENVSQDEIVPKNFQFVVDRSGSMDGYKVEQAKDAAAYAVANLSGKDLFDVISFDDYVEPLFNDLEPASVENKAQGAAFIEALSARGMTDVYGALSTALDADYNDDFARIIVFLTDGQPTAGEYQLSDEIRSHIKAKNESDVRIFSFGIGTDVDKQFLTALSAENQGEAFFLDENADIAAELALFFDTINRPVLTDIAVDYGSVDVSEVYPEKLTDLYAGTQLFVVGRYQAGSPTTVALTGDLKGDAQEFEFELDFPKCAEGSNPFLPRVWAKAKIDALLAQIAMEGEDPALVQTVIELAQKYGIQTPYTSYSDSQGGSYGCDAYSACGNGSGDSGYGGDSDDDDSWFSWGGGSGGVLPGSEDPRVPVVLGLLGLAVVLRILHGGRSRRGSVTRPEVRP